MNLPKEYQTVMPYLILRDVAAFIAFTKKVFGAEELAVYRHEDGNIMHAEIQIGGSTIMMGQSNEDWGVQNAGLYIHVESTDITFQKALDEGATVVMPVEDKDYGRTSGSKDPQGNTWWITQHLG